MIKWENVETALFDMDGTIIDLIFDSRFWSEHLPHGLAQKHGYSLEKAKARVQEHSDAVYGTLPWYCIDAWSEELDINVGDLKPALKHLIQFRPHAEKLLQTLKQLNITTLLVTNAHPTSLSLKMTTCPFSGYFNHIISAHDYGFAKESQDFWTKLKKNHPFEPSKTVFFDDNEQVLAQAKSQEIKFLFSIAQPDSSNQPRKSSDFPLLECFSEILPQYPHPHKI